ncbi:MAG: LysR family transcriptional regulator [Deltaproteobacteria bacterium]|nr:LysR family transcriptional regulator [Deltaproteobacteria bacterium]
MNLPDLESLRCFAAVARLRSFRAAAQAVALSPTAFSERIRRLESDLGVVLLERTTRSVALTEAGERLLPQVTELLAQAQNLQALVLAGGVPPFALTIGTRFELGLSWLVPALDQLAAACPQRTLHVRFGDTDELVRAVVLGLADAAITSARLAVVGLEYAPLHEEHYVVVGAPGLPPLDGPEDAPRHVLLDTGADLPLFRYLLDAAPTDQPWQFARHEYLGAIAAIRHRALLGRGVAVLPHYFVDADCRAGRLQVRMPHVELHTDHFRLLWRRDHPRRQALAELAAQLRTIALS